MTSYLLSNQVVVDVEWTISEIEKARGEVSPSLIDRLRQHLGNADRSRVVADLALGTLRARSLGKAQPGWLFTRQMAEQATHPVVAAYHAEAFRGLETVLDICTGPGVDASALAQVVNRVITVEADEQVYAVATSNLLRHGVQNVELLLGQWPDDIVRQHQWDGVWADPSRRSDGRRVFDAKHYEPALSSIPDARRVGVKVGPGDQIPTGTFSSEYIGVAGECRERILWWGDEMLRPLVTLLSDAHTPVSWSPQRDEVGQQSSVVDSGEYLIEPHNAIIASGAVGAFFVEKGASVFDTKIAYGVLDSVPAPSPWYDAYRIEAILQGVPLRRIQEEVRSRKWGSGTVIKKRGWDKDPEQFRRQLDFVPDGEPGVILIARVGSAHITILATVAERRESL